MRKHLIVITGPTASGKTSLSVRLAKLFNTEIISADSRQIFKELVIGTAKPSPQEMEEAVHHFINSHSIKEDYSIGKYEKDALDILEKIFKSHDVAVLTGGSGLYIKVVCEGMDEIPDADPYIREELNTIYKNSGLEILLNELKKSDPEYFSKVDQSNSQRVIRALEVIRSTGMPFSSFRKGNKAARPFNIIKIGLVRDRKDLYKRIDDRMDEMISKGLFEEAKDLYKFKEKNALQTVGYKEIFDYLDGKYEKEEAVRLLKRNSRRYAKRQLTWFNNDKDIVWFDAKEEEGIIEFIRMKLKD